jgi:Zn-dependent protease
MQNLSAEFLAIGVVWYVVFLLSTTCHEAAHALAAKLGGDPTAFHGGQVTLNPLPHIQREPFGMVLFPIASYLLGGWMMGWASAPYDPAWQQRYPRRAAWMALAGPAANFALMGVAAIAIRMGLAAGYFRAPEQVNFTRVTELAATTEPSFLTTFLSVLFVLNLILATFNLLPVPPLDGSSGITLLMPQRVALAYTEFIEEPMFRMAGLVAAWYLYGEVFDFFYPLALSLLYFPVARYG